MRYTPPEQTFPFPPAAWPGSAGLEQRQQSVSRFGHRAPQVGPRPERRVALSGEPWRSMRTSTSFPLPPGWWILAATVRPLTTTRSPPSGSGHSTASDSTSSGTVTRTARVCRRRLSSPFDVLVE